MKATNFLEKISQLTPDNLSQIKGLGPVLVQNLIDFGQSDRYSNLAKKFRMLEQEGIIVKIESASSPGLVVNGKLSGEVICITGVFSRSRNEIAIDLQAQGAKVVDSVTKSTTILLAGEKAGSKLEKAEKLGIKIINDYTELIQ